jgi:DNA replication and repair protein RecF
VVFATGANVFVGDNGHGKTNILEALSLFKFGRSFRTSRDTDMVCFSEPFCRAEVVVEYSSGDGETFTASIERGGAKRIKVSDTEIPKLSELVGRYPCVLFGPQDLSLVSGAPAERRRFLDMTGSMTDRLYLDELRAYGRVLKQRNALLKTPGNRTARRVWDEELIQHGCALSKKRIELVDALRVHLLGHLDSLGVGYPVNVSYDAEFARNAPNEMGDEELFAALMANVEEEEERRRTTLVGPHRDDVRFALEDRDARRFASQGQRRLLAVLLRLTELSYLEEKLGEPCVLFLDDLFSELDHDVGQKLKRLLNKDHQIFVTSPVTMEWGEEESVRVFHIVEGCVGR